MQVLDAEAVPLAETIDLQHAKPAAFHVDERHTYDRVQIERGDRMARGITLVALQILADQADAFVERAFDNRSTEGQLGKVMPGPPALRADDQLIVFTQDRHDAVG